MITHPKRNDAIAMRRAGASFRDIERALGIRRSTLSYMLRNVQLTSEQEESLRARVINNRAAFRDWCANNLSPEDLRRMGHKGGTAVWQKHGWRLLPALVEAGQLCYRKDELPAKTALEALYGVRFCKERIGRCTFDFACSTMLIEHSADSGKGLTLVVRRFGSLGADCRKRIAYVDTTHLGVRRAANLAALSVEVHDFRELIQDEDRPADR